VLIALFVLLVATITFARAVAMAAHKLAIVAVLVGWMVGVRGASGTVFAIVTAVATAVAGARAALGHGSSPVLSRWVERMASFGGTSFRGANLDGARVAEARFKSADFRGAHFDAVDWTSPLEVDFCRFDEGPHSPPRKRYRRPRPARA
jgi:hypothetical protein